MDKKHLIIISFAFLCTAIVVVGLRIPGINLGLFSRADLSNAQQACSGTDFTISAQPTGHTYAKKCVNTGDQIYSDDPRFTFFDVAGGILPQGFNFVQTDNVASKNDLNLNWSITLQANSTVYVYYRRKIAQTAPPAWLTDRYTSNTAQTPIDTQSLNHYLLRKRTGNSRIGVYDPYFLDATAGTVINFGPASTDTSRALSMYIVAVVPEVTPSPSPTTSSNPEQTCAPGLDCNNDGATPTPVATASPVVTPTPSPIRTASPVPTATADATADPGSTANPNARETSVYLQTQNGSGQSGYAVITEMSATQTRVSLSLFGGSYTNQPAHIHSGTCAAPGGVIYTLNNVSGTSITYLNVPYSTVVGNLGIVNIHKSVAESGVYTACGAK